jgi:hypothetical protein
MFREGEIDMKRLWIAASVLAVTAGSAVAQLAPPVIPGAANTATAAIEQPAQSATAPVIQQDTAAPAEAMQSSKKRHGCGASASNQPLTN